MTTPSMPDPIDLELLDRFVAGECTPDEVRVMERWLAASPENVQFYQALQAELGTPRGQPEPSEAHQVWAGIARRIDAAESAPDHRRVIPFQITPGDALGTTERRFRQWGRYAATVAAAAVLIVGAVSVYRTDLRSSRGQPAASAREYVTIRGQRAEFRLVDGTRVVLGPASRLTVPAQYDSVSREAVLDGEAYFDVVHNEQKLFQVRAGHAIVRDLGTRFVVRAIEGEDAVRVVVTEGEVSLATVESLPRSEGDSMPPPRILLPGTLGRIDAAGRTTVTTGVDTTRFTSWTHGTLVFNQTPVREVLTELARWYDVDVQIASSALARRTVSATLRDQSLAEVLDLVAVSVGARVEHVGRRVVLHLDDRAEPQS